MKTFTGYEYLLIDAANNFGHDKLTFEERIQWANEHLHELENLIGQAENKPLYTKAVMAIRKAQQGLPTGHLIGLDACCSGIQVMSAMTGCIPGATSTGMVDPEVRADAYSNTTEEMNQVLVEEGLSVDITRKQAKEALMTSFYGSREVPKRIFGDNTPELKAFYAAAETIAPGAWELLQTLVASWRPFALEHSWKLPDGYDAKVRVMELHKARIEVDELGHASLTYEFEVNEGKKRGVANVANLTHSMDAWVLRSMHRRCNYDREVAENAADLIQFERMRRLAGEKQQINGCPSKTAYYIEQYRRSSLADVVILPWLTVESVAYLDDAHLEGLAKILAGMLQYLPFALVTVHDEFKAHPNNLNWVRWQYREIMAEIAESTVLDDLLTQLFQEPVAWQKPSFNLADKIRHSNYALS